MTASTYCYCIVILSSKKVGALTIIYFFNTKYTLIYQYIDYDVKACFK